MRLGINTFLFTSPFTNDSTKLFKRFKQWGFETVEIPDNLQGLLLARIARGLHNLPPVLNLERLIGARGVSRSGLNPEGVVHVGGQLWSARLRGGRLEAGQPIRVVARHGLILEVESATLGAATRKGLSS